MTTRSRARDSLDSTARRMRIVYGDEVYARAKKQREDFYGKEVSREIELPFSWPKKMLWIGRCKAQIYRSNKMLNGGKWETYKHIAEAGQDLFVNPKITSLIGDDGLPVKFEGEDVPIFGDMPGVISVLAENKALQTVLADGQYFQIVLPGSQWASAVDPTTEETMLLCYSDEGIHFLVTGEELEIGEHGVGG